jgi:hypothetical protein
MSEQSYRPKYLIDAENGLKFIRCLTCGLASFHPGDVENLYCGNCHVFHEQEGEELGKSAD